MGFLCGINSQLFEKSHINNCVMIVIAESGLDQMNEEEMKIISYIYFLPYLVITATETFCNSTT